MHYKPLSNGRNAEIAVRVTGAFGTDCSGYPQHFETCYIFVIHHLLMIDMNENYDCSPI
jgi:hypothetical protein